MKIQVTESPFNGEELEILIKCQKENEGVQNLVKYLEEFQQSIPCSKGKQTIVIPLQEIFYFEVVENKTFVYLMDQVYQTSLKLYELEERLTISSFIRVSKSMMLNILKIEQVSPGFNSRFEAQLENGEKVIISRRYAPLLKEKLSL